jgi:hypothetical protein
MTATSPQHHTVDQTDAPTTPKTPTVEKLLYSKAEVSHALGISCRSVSYLIQKKQLSVRKLGGRTLIPKGEVVRLSRQDIASLTS